MPQPPPHRRFLNLFLAHQGALKGYLLAATGSPADADDLLQDVSHILWEKFDSYDPARPFRGWALGVARLAVLDWRRRQARSLRVLSPEAIDTLTAAAAASGDLEGYQAHLRGCLEQLSADWKRIVRLAYLESLPLAHVAEALGRSVAAVEMALVRARRALKDCVERRLATPEARP
jgi:RNA polymerase sigma-70 factor (ECF subfamily)